MRHINGGYTSYFNKRHNRYGHLFQGRYKAILVDADHYAGELSRYVHLNPVRAGLIRKPEQYQWSSYTAYSGNAKPPRWLTTDWLLQYFGQKHAAARKTYILFVNAALGTDQADPLEEATSTLILGKTDFIDQIREKYLGGRKIGRDLPALKELTSISLADIIKTVEREFRYNPVHARKAAIYISHRYSGRTLREIGQAFSIGESAVSQASSRFEGELEGSRPLKKRVERITKALAL
jgi:hypothetical protein